MINNTEMLKARDEYINLIKCELLGPGSEISVPDAEHELISDSPEQRYSIGILFPKNSKMNADNNENTTQSENDDSEEDEAIEVSEEREDDEVSKGVFDSEDDENLDEEIGLASQNMPSSCGMTFFVKGECTKIECDIKFAKYRKAKAEDCCIPISVADPDNFVLSPFLSGYISYDKSKGMLKLVKGGITRKDVMSLNERGNWTDEERGCINAMYQLCAQLKRGYVRVPHNAKVILDFSEADYIDNNHNINETSLKLTALRRHISEGVYSVTVMAVNDIVGTEPGVNCIFQPEIRISTDNNDFCFSEYSSMSDVSVLDEEEKSLALQYRNKKTYGSGLGVSVNWNIGLEGKGELFTDFFPTSEVPSMDYTMPKKYNVPDVTMSMKYLSDLNNNLKTEKIEKLKLFVNAYKAWIDELNLKLSLISYELKDVANKNINGCISAYNRMIAGIELLATDDKVWDSFVLANRAMYMQRVHLKLQVGDRERYPGDEELSGILENLDYYDADKIFKDSYSWRPFQLAFLLMSITSLTRDDLPERDLVDLIWFPTGGGKTEAYLGLTAFTVFFRRLNYPKEAGGTTVIMRYTLRLLAAQQFTRASTLICACEYIRKDSIGRRPKYKAYPLGNESITIGLWIGGEHTPNKNDKAKELIKKLNEANVSNLKYTLDANNKFQVLKCPWCGTKLVKGVENKKLIGSFGYVMKNNRHFELHCPQEECHFCNEGKLPIQIVDEELYSNPPTLLFGTVDKFAMLPWKKEIGSFFAVNRDNRAPDLIIQDELHLISGPLGTMVGLYETVIDKLCSAKGVKPKIVASTATIRRAKEQCAALYNRDVNQFPHPGLDAEDSFYARESVINYNNGIFGRKYVGLMPSGKTKATMEVRAMAALLQRLYKMNIPEEIKDKFWTLTVYFNNLKDLGKCATLVDDDVRDAIRRTALRVGSLSDIRTIGQADELTGRVPTAQLNQTLDKLEKLEYSEKNREEKRYASNTLLATNMISVGIDIERLNAMLMVGQPKLTSEYIQASSRVGRKYPGVAFIMYDGSKSRDRSHYEQFKPYHESFYKFVEPTGATPFSKPARERALHAIAFAIMRHTVNELSADKDASLFNSEKYSSEIKKIREYILQRAKEINDRINPKIVAECEAIAKEVDLCFEKWEGLAESYDEDKFVYGEKYMVKYPEDNEGSLLKAYNSRPKDNAFDTMTSLRNVDTTVAGNVLIWEE